MQNQRGGEAYKKLYVNCKVIDGYCRVKEEKEAKKVPLSLEELLAKKKAEEEALSKVSSSAG